MAFFFSLIGKHDEIEVIDLLLSRYGSADYAMNLDVVRFAELVDYAFDKVREESAKLQWNAMLPYMSLKMLKYMPFREYLDNVTGRNIDMRPADEIMREIEEAHRAAEMHDYKLGD